jgi:nucleotide-binding universal stress UspA family protein
METLRILIPTDFSDQATYAWHMVESWKENLPMEVHFLHVIDAPDTVSLDSNGAIQTCGDIDARSLEVKRQEAMEKLRPFQQKDAQVKVLPGKLTDVILHYSTEIKADLIVMGSKGAHGLKEVIAGSELQQVARRSLIPVLSMKCDRMEFKPASILLVHDFSDQQNSDFRLLKAMRQAFSAEIHLLQFLNEGEWQEKTKWEGRMRAYAEQNQLGVVVPHLYRELDVETGVEHFIQEQDFDLICIGTHGRSAWSRMFRSSPTERLLNHLHKPILSFHLT